MKNNMLTVILSIFSLSFTACTLDTKMDSQADRREADKHKMNQEKVFNKKWYFEDLSSEFKDANTTKAYIKFENNGSVSGFSGCNRFHGQVKVTESDIILGPLGSTRKACPKVMAYEAKILKMLRRVNRYVLRDGLLKLYRDENQLGILK